MPERILDRLYEDVRKVEHDTAEALRTIAVHEADCSGRYQELKRDVRDLKAEFAGFVLSFNMSRRFIVFGIAVTTLIEVGNLSLPTFLALIEIILK